MKEDEDSFQDILGYRLVNWEEGRVELEVSVAPKHLNLAGVIHGGVLASLLDVALAAAGTYCPYPGRMRRAITLSLTTTFTGQCSGGNIRIIGIKRAGGNRVYNSSGEVIDQHGRLLAIGEGTFRLRTGSNLPEGVPITEAAKRSILNK